MHVGLDFHWPLAAHEKRERERALIKAVSSHCCNMTCDPYNLPFLHLPLAIRYAGQNILLRKSDPISYRAIQ